MESDRSADSAAMDLSIVVPVYREELGIRPFLARLEAVMKEMGVTYEVIFSLDPLA